MIGARRPESCVLGDDEVSEGQRRLRNMGRDTYEYKLNRGLSVYQLPGGGSNPVLWRFHKDGSPRSFEKSVRVEAPFLPSSDLCYRALAST